MMKGKGSPILVMLGLVFLGGWSARAEPPVTLSTDEITEEDGSGIPSLRQPPLGHVTDNEQVLQGDHEVMHQDGSDTHHHDSTAGEHMMDAEGDHDVIHQGGAEAHHHDSTAGEHMMSAEGMGSHSEDMLGPMGDGNVEHARMHEAGPMGESDGAMMNGNARGQAESTMGPTGGGVSEMSRRGGGMMGGGEARNSAGGMHGGH
jgi:hypothetical protein